MNNKTHKIDTVFVHNNLNMYFLLMRGRGANSIKTLLDMTKQSFSDLEIQDLVFLKSCFT